MSVKFLLVVLCVFLSLSRAASAADSIPLAPSPLDAGECIKTFYQIKDMACIDVVTDQLNQIPGAPTQKTITNSQNAAGFLAVVFADYPDQKKRLLAQKTSPTTNAIFIEALYEGELFADAQSFADASGLTNMLTFYQTRQTPTLKALTPSTDPGDNDLLMGAYMASGRTEYISSILANFVSADDEMVKDALRLSFMQGKFGPTLAPPGRDKVMVNAACQRYKCQANMQAMMRVMTLSSAYWALHSLSAHDDGIQKTLDIVFTNPRLKQLLGVEQSAFSAYLTNLAVAMAVADNAHINHSLSNYEHLGAAEAP
jgi:hypothetical protein